MSTIELKQKLTQLINSTDDDELLNEIYQMVSEDNNLYRLSDEQRVQIIKAKNEIKSGAFSTHEEVKKRTSEWLGK